MLLQFFPGVFFARNPAQYFHTVLTRAAKFLICGFFYLQFPLHQNTPFDVLRPRSSDFLFWLIKETGKFRPRHFFLFLFEVSEIIILSFLHSRCCFDGWCAIVPVENAMITPCHVSQHYNLNYSIPNHETWCICKISICLWPCFVRLPSSKRIRPTKIHQFNWNT